MIFFFYNCIYNLYTSDAISKFQKNMYKAWRHDRRECPVTLIYILISMNEMHSVIFETDKYMCTVIIMSYYNDGPTKVLIHHIYYYIIYR